MNPIVKLIMSAVVFSASTIACSHHPKGASEKAQKMACVPERFEVIEALITRYDRSIVSAYIVDRSKSVCFFVQQPCYENAMMASVPCEKLGVK